MDLIVNDPAKFISYSRAMREKIVQEVFSKKDKIERKNCILGVIDHYLWWIVKNVAYCVKWNRKTIVLMRKEESCVILSLYFQNQHFISIKFTIKCTSMSEYAILQSMVMCEDYINEQKMNNKQGWEHFDY